MKKMNIAVTGAAGHIGAALIRSLAVQFPGGHLTLIDNMLTQRFSSLFDLPNLCSYKFLELDVRNADLKKILSGVDVVVHLAAITDAAGSFDRADEVESNNFISTKLVAEACLEVGAKLIALSSTSVYGTQSEVVSESCRPEDLRPQSPYAATKLREEQLIAQMVQKGLLAVSCRFGTIFGKSIGMRFHTAVNKFCWQAALGEPITVWRTAFDQKRPYLDLQDALRLVDFIIKNNLFDGQVYNAVTQNLTVRQIVNTISEFVPGLEVVFVDNKIMNQLSYEVSCQKLLGKGFIFSGDLRRGVGETIALLKNCNTL